MKHTLKPLVVIILTVLTLIGCEQDKVPPEYGSAVDIQRYDELVFIYQVTDMEGNPKTTFQEGENFMFSFIVKNHGAEERGIGWWSFPIENKDFFAVYRISNEGRAYIGKSFDFGVNTRDKSTQLISGKEEIEYRIPWLTEKNISYRMPVHKPDKEFPVRRYAASDPLPVPLPKGEYVSGFTLELKDQELSFEITFSVQ